MNISKEFNFTNTNALYVKKRRKAHQDTLIASARKSVT